MVSHDPRLDSVLSYLKAKCNSIFISGGAVVDFDKASDVDVWFGRDNTDGAKAFGQSLPFWKEGQMKSYPGKDFTIVGEGFVPQVEKIIQVMVTEKTNCIDVMNEFDISTHCKTYSSKGDYYYTSKFDHPAFLPKVINVNSQTFSRYIKICLRYGHNPDPVVLKMLIGQADSVVEYQSLVDDDILY